MIEDLQSQQDYKEGVNVRYKWAKEARGQHRSGRSQKRRYDDRLLRSLDTMNIMLRDKVNYMGELQVI
jgi:hypothetical protein